MIDPILNNVDAYTIIAAFLAFAGASGGAIALLMSSRRSIYINSVTVERSTWIEKLRSSLARFICLADEVHEYYRDAENIPSEYFHDFKLFRKLKELEALISLQLNSDRDIDREVMWLAGSIFISVRYADTQTHNKAQALLSRHAQWLLKQEWEIVKFEARGPFGRLHSRWRRMMRARAYKDYRRTKGNTRWVRDLASQALSEHYGFGSPEPANAALQ